MKQLICSHLVLCVIFFNAIIFSSDNHMGIIDTFILIKEVTPRIHDISFKYKNKFDKNEPVFITIDGSIHAINMPTTIKPFIVTIHDAQNIIDTNRTIFCTENIKPIILSGSKNESNKIIHEKLSHKIIPIDHCTHIKCNGTSIDIVSLFFNTLLLNTFITKLKNQQKTLSRNTKKTRLRDFLSVPKNNDSAILSRANRRYYGDDLSEDENPDIVHVSVSNYDLWNNASSD